MRINLHCHVFNLQSVFSQATRDIIDRRIRDAGLAHGVSQIVLEVIEGLLGHPEAVERLQQFVDPRQRNDFLEFLKVALLPDMDQVTNWLIGQLPDDVVVAPLMLDPTTPDAGDDALFRAQLEGTARQMFRYPGRVLPFVAVNPLRPNWRDYLASALARGFVGVKLYPSLGYDIESQEIEEAVRLCAKRRAPIVQHCSRGGFYADARWIDNSRPLAWATYLEDIAGLTVCFAHFGGEEDFAGGAPPDDSNWTRDIVALMKAYPGKVYADLAYHTSAMPPNPAGPYRERLAAILADPELRPYVLWGTDSLMVRMACTEREYWDFFQGLLPREDFGRLSRDNPMRFLGFGPSGPADNIRAHVAYLSANRDRFQLPPAPWLGKYLASVRAEG